MNTVVIEGQRRSDTGKKAARDLRAQGQVPCIIYGGKEEISFTTSAKALKSIVYTPDFMTAEIQVDGQTYRCILKDLQFDVVTDALNHVDFLELVEDKKVIANLPMRFTGQSVGVKAGGRLEIKMKTLKVRTYPKHLVESLEVDITNLDINENIRVEDVKADHMEKMTSMRQPVASIVMTRALRQAETEDKKAK